MTNNTWVDPWGRPIAPPPQQPQVDQWGRPIVYPQIQPQVDQWGRPIAPPPQQPQVDAWGRPITPPLQQPNTSYMAPNLNPQVSEVLSNEINEKTTPQKSQNTLPPLPEFNNLLKFLRSPRDKKGGVLSDDNNDKAKELLTKIKEYLITKRSGLSEKYRSHLVTDTTALVVFMDFVYGQSILYPDDIDDIINRAFIMFSALYLYGHNFISPSDISMVNKAVKAITALDQYAEYINDYRSNLANPVKDSNRSSDSPEDLFNFSKDEDEIKESDMNTEQSQDNVYVMDDDLLSLRDIDDDFIERIKDTIMDREAHRASLGILLSKEQSDILIEKQINTVKERTINKEEISTPFETTSLHDNITFEHPSVQDTLLNILPFDTEKGGVPLAGIYKTTVVNLIEIDKAYKTYVTQAYGAISDVIETSVSNTHKKTATSLKNILYNNIKALKADDIATAKAPLTYFEKIDKVITNCVNTVLTNVLHRPNGIYMIDSFTLYWADLVKELTNKQTNLIVDHIVTVLSQFYHIKINKKDVKTNNDLIIDDILKVYDEDTDVDTDVDTTAFIPEIYGSIVVDLTAYELCINAIGEDEVALSKIYNKSIVDSITSLCDRFKVPLKDIDKKNKKKDGGDTYPNYKPIIRLITKDGKAYTITTSEVTGTYCISRYT